MPNHVHSFVKITGEGVAAIKSRIGSRKLLKEKGLLSLLVPMPEVVGKTIAGSPEFYYSEWEKKNKPVSFECNNVMIRMNDKIDDSPTAQTYKELFECYKASLEQTGHRNWYTWACANWGSKWGFYDTHVYKFRKNLIEFRAVSAWDIPAAGLETIAKEYSVEIEITSDEEMGNFCSWVKFYPTGVNQSISLDGVVEKGDTNLTEEQFDRVKPVLRLVDSGGDINFRLAEELTYKEYQEWNNG